MGLWSNVTEEAQNVYVVEMLNENGVKYWVPRWSFYEKPMKSQYVLMKESQWVKR